MTMMLLMMTMVYVVKNSDLLIISVTIINMRRSTIIPPLINYVVDTVLDLWMSRDIEPNRL